MFNFVKDVTSVTSLQSGHSLDSGIPRWNVLFGSGWVLVVPD